MIKTDEAALETKLFQLSTLCCCSPFSTFTCTLRSPRVVSSGRDSPACLAIRLSECEQRCFHFTHCRAPSPPRPGRLSHIIRAPRLVFLVRLLKLCKHKASRPIQNKKNSLRAQVLQHCEMNIFSETYGGQRETGRGKRRASTFTTVHCN